MRFRVTTPEEKFTGEVAGVSFAKGVAEVDGDEHRDALRYFRSAGYAVEPVDEDPVEPEQPAEPQKPAQSASKAEWVAWAVHNGMSAEEADALNKPDLVAKLAELDENPGD